MVEGRQKAPFPGLKRNTESVPGMPGAYLQSTDIEPLEIEQPFGFLIDNEDWLDIKDELAAWLFTKDPKPLEFPDEPGRVYYAVVQNSIDDFERVARTRMRKGTINFLCFDPFAYGQHKVYNLSDTSTIQNDGTAETYPVFDLEVQEETTLIKLGNTSNEDDNGDTPAMYFGTETDVDEDTDDNRVLILHDTMQSTSDWEDASNVDNGEVVGTMETDSDGFYAKDSGEDDTKLTEIRVDIERTKRDIKKEDDKDKKNELKKELKDLRKERDDIMDDYSNGYWVGPSMQRELDDTLESFQMDFKIENMNYKDGQGNRMPQGVGIIEIYLRDVNDKMICKLQFGDTTADESINKGLFAIPEKQYNIEANNPTNWNNYDGIIRITRDSGYFYPKIAHVVDGNVWSWKTLKVIPVKEAGGDASVAQHEIKTIQVALRKYIGSQRIHQRIKEMKVWDMIGMYEYPDKNPVHKFKEGDKIHFDAGTGLFLVNDEPGIDMGLLHLKADYWSLVPGENELDFRSDVVDGTVSFTERYL